MIRRATIALVVVYLIGLGQTGHAQTNSSPATPTPSGFYYPIMPTGGVLWGFHRVAGMGADRTSGYGGHFMSPGSQENDFHTGREGRYFNYKYHNGMDVMAPYGTPVYAITDGFVDYQNTFSTAVSSGWTSSAGCTPVCTANIGLIVFGFTGVGEPFKTIYGHVEKSTVDPALLQSGATVRAGQYIGRIGSYSGGNHLHFGIHVGGGDLPYSAALGRGYGMIRIESNWPDRHGWVDPVMFIESQCVTGVVCYANRTDDFVAQSDMKTQMIGKFKSTLFTWDGYFGYWYSDQYWKYHYQWFNVVENGQLRWYFAEHITLISDPSVRYVTYQDYTTQRWEPTWYRVVVIP